jgi:hypothetical protein
VVARLIVIVLSLSLATSGALPLWALLVGIDAAHVCHCAIDKHDCVCAKCNPEHEDALTSESLKGRCGDDEAAFTGKAIVGVLSSPSVFVAAATDQGCAIAPPVAPVLVAARAPPTPPPRSSSSRTV